MPTEKEQNNVNNIVLFNVSNQKAPNIWSVNSAWSDLTIPVMEINQVIENSLLNKEQLVNAILDEAKQLERAPLLNILVNSNMEEPLVDVNDLTALKKLGIKFCFTFTDYNTSREAEQYKWSNLLSEADHIFFANDRDQYNAIRQNHLNQEKTSNFQLIPAVDLLESEILSRPPNILITEAEFDSQKLQEATKAANHLGNNTRVIVASTPSSPEEVTNIIASKFAINDQNHLIGIQLEVEGILKDKINGNKKLEQYVSQLSGQFQKDTGLLEKNPIDIYFDLSDPTKLGQIAKQAKYTITQDQSVKNLINGCIPLSKGQGKSQDIVAEIRERENDQVLNSVTIQSMQHSLNECRPDVVSRRITNILQQVSNPVNNSPFNQQNKLHSQLENNELTTPDYLYTEDDISKLLKISVDQSKVSIVQHASITEEQLLKETINEAINNDLNKENKQAVIIPLNTGYEHWVSLAITKDKDNNVSFIYNDPMGTPVEQRASLTNMIEEVCPEAKIVDLGIRQQQNDKDCAPFVVDNLIKMAKGEAILTTEQSENMGAILRQSHTEITKIPEQAKQMASNMIKRFDVLKTPHTSIPAVRKNNNLSRTSSITVRS